MKLKKIRCICDKESIIKALKNMSFSEDEINLIIAILEETQKTNK